MISLITGDVAIHEEDFSLPGPIPFVWQRNFFSDIDRNTLTGSYWHCNYDQSIEIDKEEEDFIWTNGNGNILYLPYLPIGEEAVIISEKIKYRHEKNKIIIENYEEDLTYHYAFAGGKSGTYNLIQIKKHRFAITFFYDFKGHLEYIKDSSNRKISVIKDYQQRIQSLELLSDQEAPKTLVSYQYNENNQLESVFDAVGIPAKYEYTNGLLTTLTNRNGHQQYWQYNTSKDSTQCVARWYTHKKNYESFLYEKNKTIVTDARGNKTIHFHDNGNITSVQNAKGETEHWEYTLENQVLRYTDPLGYHTYYGYDEYGNQTSVRLPNGGSTNYIYENNNQWARHPIILQ